MSTTLGSQTITVTAPAGAIASSSTVKVTLETPNSLTTPFSVARAAAAAKRTTQSVPSGAVAIAAFIVDAGGATLTAPLQVSFTGIAAPATGQSVLISGFNANAFADVSTTTYANGTTSTATDVHYPGITLASPTIYVIYTVPTANVATPTATIAIAGPASAASGSTDTYVATETTSNGFPFLNRTFTYGVSSGALGTINPKTGVLVAGGVGGAGTVSATDTVVTSFTGTETVSIVSARPGVAGVTQQYAGTLTEVDANDAINGASPPPSLTTVSKATVSVVSSSDAADTSGTQTGVTFTANETDASNLTTLTSTTTSTVLYQQQSSGPTNVRLKKTVANESSGVVYEHDYTGTSGLTTVLPEIAQTFSNDASETYLETDPGISVTNGMQQVTTTKTINADGSYTATYQEPNISTGAPATDTATENSDFSGFLALNSVDPGFQVQFSAPSNGTIAYAIVDPNLSLDNPATTASYIPATSTQPSSETDTITPSQQLDASCTNATTYASANKIVQSKTVVDAIFGTVETKTLTAYDVNSVGTVCTVVADTVKSFYDYSGQEGPYLLTVSGSATAPVLTTTISETLSLQSVSSAQTQSAGHSQQSVGSALALPIETIAAHVEHLARQREMQRIASFRQAASIKIRGGSVK